MLERTWSLTNGDARFRRKSSCLDSAGFQTLILCCKNRSCRFLLTGRSWVSGRQLLSEIWMFIADSCLCLDWQMFTFSRWNSLLRHVKNQKHVRKLLKPKNLQSAQSRTRCFRSLCLMQWQKSRVKRQRSRAGRTDPDQRPLTWHRKRSSCRTIIRFIYQHVKREGPASSPESNRWAQIIHELY